MSLSSALNVTGPNPWREAPARVAPSISRTPAEELTPSLPNAQSTFTGSAPSQLLNTITPSSSPFKIVDAKVGGFGYAYGPSIIYSQGVYHAYFCSGGTGANDWDHVRHATSSDLIHWSDPDTTITSTNFERSNCDPSVVRYNAGDGLYYYMFFSGNLTDVQTVNFVARSASPNGPFLKYTDRGTWEANPTDSRAITRPFKSGAEGSNVYGAGEPTVVVHNGMLYMWYANVDLSGKPNGIYFNSSKDGISWSAPVYTGVDDVSVDVKFDPASGLFVMTEITPQLSDQAQLLMRTSSDGIIWSKANVVCDSNCLPHGSSNVGVSGDDQGQLIPNTEALIGFGAPYILNSTGDSWGLWNLYGQLYDIHPKSHLTPSTDLSTLPIFRSYQAMSGDHLFSLSATEGKNAGYNDEGVGFNLFSSSSASRRPLYRCFALQADHFISTDENCEGQGREGLLGYVETQKTSTAPRALYRCFGPKHLETTNVAECVGTNVSIEVVLGYVL